LLPGCKTTAIRPLSELTDDYLTEFVRARRKGGAGGVTIAIDLTYLAGVFKTAKELWKMPVSFDAINTARSNMAHLEISTRSTERIRRPTVAELEALQEYLDTRSSLPMRDIIDFAVESAMRVDEITRLRWSDLNEDDRTIIIRDRKHPRQRSATIRRCLCSAKRLTLYKDSQDRKT
jgi:integrase